MKITSLEKLFTEQIQDIYSAENQLVKALPKMAKKASSAALVDAFTSHLEETKGHVERLEKIGEALEIKLTGKTCHAMKGLIEEGSEVIEADGVAPLIDMALIVAAQRVEHYEISAYGSARTLAEHLGYKKILPLLQQTLDEESAADEKLTNISTDEVLPSVETSAGGPGK